MPYASTNSNPSEIKLFYQIYDERTRPKDAILFNTDTDEKFSQDVLNDLVDKGLLDENLEQQFNNKKLYFKVFRKDEDEIPDDAITLANVSLLPNRGLLDLEDALQNTLSSSLSWLGSFVPDTIKQTAYRFGDTVLEWTEDKLTGFSAYSATPEVEVMDEEVWHDIVDENSIIEESDAVETDSVEADSVETAKFSIPFSASVADATDAEKKSYAETLLDTAWNVANYARENPLKAFTLILAACSVANSFHLPKIKFENRSSLVNGMNTAADMLTKLAVAKITTSGMQTNTPFNAMVAGLSLWKPVGATTPEFQVNTYTTYDQYLSSGDVLPNGDFVMTWTSEGQDLSSSGVFAQRFNGTTTAKLGGEILVPTNTIDAQYYSRVTHLTNGNFVISWDSYQYDGTLFNVYGQIFNGTNGSKIGGPFLLNTNTTNDQHYSQVASLSSNTFVAVWQSNGNDGSGLGAFGQIFNATGGKIGPEFLVNTYTTNDQSTPRIASFPDGNSFVVTWNGYGQNNPNVSTYGQRFNSTGAKLSVEFHIPTTTIYSQGVASIATFPDGGFITTWASYGQLGAGYDIFGQRFNSTGGKSGPEFQVNLYTIGDQIQATVGSFSDGSFVIAWMSQEDGSGYGVFGQQYSADGKRFGSIFQVNNYTINDQYIYTISSFPDNRFLVAMASDGQDGANYGVFGRIFTPPRLINNTLTISEGEIITLTNAMLGAQAPQTLPAGLMLTVNNVTNVQFELVSNPGFPIFNFTQEAVKNGQIQVKHDGSEFAPTYNVKAKEVVLDTSFAPATIIFTNVNDAPVLASGGQSPAFTEKGEPVVIAPNITLSDVDSPTLTQASVVISDNLVPAEDRLSFVNQTITGSYDASKGQLLLTGTSTQEDYQNALRNVTFSTLSNNPSLLSRKISFSVNDGQLKSNTVNYTITINPVNDPPVLFGSGTTTFTEHGAPVLVAPDIITTDADSLNFKNATAALTGNFTSGEDYLSFVNQASITGIYNSSTGVLTLTGISSIANYQIALHNITYSNPSHNPSLSTRTITFTVNDGLDSNPVFYSINLIPVNDAPQLSGSVGPLTFTEKAAPIAIGRNFSITDPDSFSITNATVAITANFAGSEDVLAFPDQSGITGNYYPATGQLFLTGFATFADYLNALGNVTYCDTSSNPSLLPRTISFAVNDGELNSNILTRSVTIIPVNDAPVLAGSGTTTFTEHGTPVPVAPDIITTDVDSINFKNATAAIAGNFTSGEDYLSFVNQAGIAGFYNSSTGVLTLTGISSIPNYQIALRNITYSNPSYNPSLFTRAITLTVNDGLDSNPVVYTVNITPVNDAPTLTGSGGTANFTEKNSAALIDPGIIVFDPDSLYLLNATVRFTSGVLPEDILSFTPQGGISGSYSNVTGVLSLTGSSSVVNYQIVLRSVTYFNPSSNPSTVLRTVSFTISDGQLNSNAVSRSISVTPVNDPPVLTGSGATTFTEQGAPVPVTSDITATDIDSTNFVRATAAIAGNFTSGDQLFFVNQAGITGVYNSSTGVLTLTGISSIINYQIALCNITYATPSNNPLFLTRNISFTVNDGLTSNPVFYTINLIPVNDPPTLTGTGSTLAFTEKNPATPINPGIVVSDPDSATLANATVRFTSSVLPEDVLGFIPQGGISGAYNNITGILVLIGPSSVTNFQSLLSGVTYFNPSLNPSATLRTVSFKVNDGQADSNIVTRNISVTPVNDPPVLITNTLTITGGQARNLTSTDLRATDPDTPDSALTFTVSGLQFCRFENTTQAGTSITRFTQQEVNNNLIRIIPTGGITSAPAYQVSVSDGQYSTPPASASVNFNGLFPPVITANKLTIKQGETVILTPIQLNAIDPDTPSSGLTYTVSNVRYGFFTIVGSSQIITSFTQQSLSNGFVRFTQDGSENPPSYDVSVSDGSLSTNTQAAVITYINVNQGPIVINVPQDRLSEKVGQAFSFSIAANTFFDSDPGDQNALVYSATQDGKVLPAWISFDPSNRQFAGKPVVAGKIRFSVIAKDPSNAIGVANFTMDVGALSLEQTPVIPSLPPDYTIRNSLIGAAISGGITFGLFLVKYTIKHASNKKFDEAMERLSKNPFDNAVIKPLCIYIYKHGGMRGPFESVSNKKVDNFISSVRSLEGQIRTLGIHYEELTEGEQNLVNTIIVRELKRIAHPADERCCASLLRCGFFKAEIPPQLIDSNVVNIASEVNKALNRSKDNAAARRASDVSIIKVNPEAVELMPLNQSRQNSDTRKPRETLLKLSKAQEEAKAAEQKAQAAQQKAQELEIEMAELKKTVTQLAKAQTGSQANLVTPQTTQAPLAEASSTASQTPAPAAPSTQATPPERSGSVVGNKSGRTARPQRTLPPSTPLPQPEPQPLTRRLSM